MRRVSERGSGSIELVAMGLLAALICVMAFPLVSAAFGISMAKEHRPVAVQPGPIVVRTQLYR